MDLLILVLLVVIVGIFFRDTKRLVYLIGILELFFRLVHHIGDLLGIAVFNNFVDKYIPNSIFTIISGHTNGMLCTVLSFVVVGILVMFLFYLIKYFFKAKKL